VGEAAWEHGFARLAGIEGVGVWTPTRAMRVQVTDEDAHCFSAEEEDAWRAICAANARVHDGAILAVRGVDFGACVVTCARERYKRLAVQRALGRPVEVGSAEEVRILGVKGFITARDARGGEHVLIGRRGMQTRVYGGMWESAPAGGVAVPAAGVRELGVRELAASVEEEGEEELGLRLDARGARVVAVCRDEVAGSDDVFLAMELEGVIDPRRSPVCQHGAGGWEYSDTAWLSREDAAGFAERGLIAPVRAVMRVMGWGGSK
jgi:hypothetical protein